MGNKQRVLRKSTAIGGPLNTMKSSKIKTKIINSPDPNFSSLSNQSISSKAEEFNNGNNDTSSDILKDITPVSSPSKRTLKNVSRIVNNRQKEISLVSDDDMGLKSPQEETIPDRNQAMLENYKNVSKKRHERNHNINRTNLVNLDQNTDMISSNNASIKTIITTQKIKLIKDTKMFFGKPVLLLNRDDNVRLNVTYTESLFFINTSILNFDPINISNVSQILVMNTYETMTLILNKEIRGIYTHEEVEKRKGMEEKLPSNNTEKFKYVTIKVNFGDSAQIQQFIDSIKNTRSASNEYYIKILDHDQYMERTSSFLKGITKHLSHNTHQGSEYGVLPSKKLTSNNSKGSSKKSAVGIKISSPSSNMTKATSSANTSLNNNTSSVTSSGYKPLGEVLKDGLSANSFFGKSSRTRSLSDRNPNNNSNKELETAKRSEYFENQIAEPVKRSHLTDLAPGRRTRSQTNTKKVEYAEIYDFEDINLDYKRSTKRQLNFDLKHNFLDGTSSKIHDTDFKCLNSGEWLNGTIIDFFNKYYREELMKQKMNHDKISEEDKIETYDLNTLPDDIKKEFYIFNSYFFLSLNNTEKVVNSKWLLKNNCSVMKDYKYHIIPINLNHHWFGCILENFYETCIKTKQIRDEFNASLSKHSDEGKEIVNIAEIEKKFNDGEITEKQVNDSLDRISRTRSRTRRSTRSDNDSSDRSRSPSENVPKLKNSALPKITIYVFDSLRNTHKKELNNIQQFLSVFAKQNFGIDLVPAQFKMKNCQVIQQPNMNDCGVHLISNIRAFFNDTEKTLQYWNNSKFTADDQNLITYFKGKYKEASRHNLKKIIRELLERGESGNDPYNFALKPLSSSDNGSDNEDQPDDEDLMIIEEIKPEKEFEVLEKDVSSEEGKFNEIENNEKGPVEEIQEPGESDEKENKVDVDGIETKIDKKENNVETSDNTEKKLDVYFNQLDDDPVAKETRKKNLVSVVTKHQNRISADISGKLQSHKKKSDSFVRKILDKDQVIEDEVFSESNSNVNSLSKRHVSRAGKRKYSSISK